MNSSMDLTMIGPGFSDTVATSQAVFRAGLAAMSRPGDVIDITSDARPPVGIGAAANALLLSLLDQDVCLYVSPRHASAAGYFRFHTGCSLTDDLGAADFLLIGADDSLPDLSTLKTGSEFAPEQSATVVREVTGLAGGQGLKLHGPGIRIETRLHAAQLDDAFVKQRRNARDHLPRGVDIFLTCAERLCGLPRTTRIEA